MTRKSKIVSGLKDAVHYARGDHTRGIVRNVPVEQPVDVRDIRLRQGLSQIEFARKYGFPIGTLRGWEQGRRAPVGATRNYLVVIDKQPHAVESALST